MRVHVFLFARARELYGEGETTVELPAAASVADCFAQLTARSPRLASMRDALLVARNQAYADWNDPLEEGDEIGFIPPVSGG